MAGVALPGPSSGSWTSLQLLFVYLVMIPLLAFNMAGGTFVPPEGTEAFPIQSLAFGALVALLGAAALVFFAVEYRRVTRREARQAEAASAAYQAG